MKVTLLVVLPLAVAAGGVAFLVGRVASESATDTPEGPASRYAISRDDLAGGRDPGIDAITEWSGATLKRPDFYTSGRPDEHVLPVVPDRWAEDLAANRQKLLDWGYDSGIRTYVRMAPQDNGQFWFAEQEVHLFDREDGAAAYFSVLEERFQNTEYFSPLEDPSLGDESILVRDLLDLKQGTQAFVVVVQIRGVVARVRVAGAFEHVKPKDAVRLAQIIVEKVAGKRESPVPTPVAGRRPTPVAPEPWMTRGGKAASPDEVNESQGAEHCDWSSYTFLFYEGRIYVRDAAAFWEIPSIRAFDPAMPMPADARDTGYRSGDRQLWFSPSKAEIGIFFMTPQGTEAWPFLPGGCA